MKDLPGLRPPLLKGGDFESWHHAPKGRPKAGEVFHDFASWKHILVAAIFCFFICEVSFAQKAPELYQRALSQERAFGDLEEAIKLFDRAANEAGNDRVLAAKAMLGEARSYEKLRNPKASTAFEALVRVYPDQREQVGIANVHLDAIALAAENFNFELGVLGQTPLFWGAGQSQQDAGFRVDLVNEGCLEGFRCAMITGVPDPQAEWFGNMSRFVRPELYLGKTVRFRAAVRVEGAGTTGRLWMRVDRVSSGFSFFDNMDKRRITPGGWNYYTIDGTVAPDTKLIYIGVLIEGSGHVWVDDASFEVVPGPVNAAISGNMSYPPDAVRPLPMKGAQGATQSIGRVSSVVPDGLGGVYISSLSNNQVYQVAFDGTLRIVAGIGLPGFGGDRGAAPAAHLSGPRQLALDSVGNLYVADTANNRIRKITLAGAISTVAGNGKNGFGGDGGPAVSAVLASPMGLAVDRSGNLFISDSQNNRIRKVTPDGSISTIAGTGNPGFSGDGGPAIFAEVNPYGLAVDAAGNLFIADGNNHRIRKITPDGLISTVAGNGTQGFRGDGGPALSAAVADPMSIAVDDAGNLFIGDLNNRIRKVTAAGVISTVAGNGTTSFSGDGGKATAAGLSSTGVAVDRAGYMYIVDSNNNRIRKVTPEGMISTVAGNGNRP